MSQERVKPAAGSEAPSVAVEKVKETPKHPLALRVEREFEHLECYREGSLRAVVSLKAEEDFPVPKPHLDLVVLINRSVSDDTLFNFKHAIEYIMTQLGSHDRLAVLAFDEKVQLVVPLDYVTRSYESVTGTWAAVDSVSPGNGKSNLGLGLKSAMELIETSSRMRLAVNAVLVLTDAVPNHGTTSTADLLKEVGLAQAEQRRELRISQRLPADQDFPWVVHTFGYGANHDPQLLTSVANAGKGVYSYIPQGALVANAVADCFGALASSVALRVEVAIRPSIGVELKSVKTCYKMTDYENGVVVDVGDLHRGEHTNIIVELLLQKLEGVPVGEQQLVDVHVKYLDLRFFDPTVAFTRLYTSVDVHRPEVVPKQLRNAHLDVHTLRFAAYEAFKNAVLNADKGSKERNKSAQELNRLAQRIEVSDVFDSKLAKSLVRDLRNCADLLRKDRTEEYIKVLWTTICQHGMERSVGHPLDDHYSTSSRASAQLRVGRSLRHALARLLESAKYSDITIAGHKLHRAVLWARCPALLKVNDVPADDQDAFRVVLRFVYSGEYIAQRRGPRDRVVDLKFRVLALARRYQLPTLEAMALKELIAYSKLDILVVKRALELNEKDIVDHWVYRFVFEPDAGALAQQDQLDQIPALVPRIVQELRLKEMKAPKKVRIPEREPLAADIGNLFNTGEESDLKLKVEYEGTRVEFSVHRSIIFSRCPMLSFQDLSKPLKIAIPPRAFRQLLVYLYSEEPPVDVSDSLYILGHYAAAGIDSLTVAKATILKYDAENCYAAYNLASRLGLRGLARAALDVIEQNFASNTRQYVESTQAQINDLRQMVVALTARVQQIEDGGNKVSDSEVDDRD